jgi:hypothetical protein
MRSKVEKVGPELAQKWIDASAERAQRSVSQKRVEKIAHAIDAGQWQVTHQGIALGENGTVLDGQHRLHAIVMAGRQVEVMVTRDAPEASFDVIDTGAVRTTADTLRIAGYTNTNVLAATVRGLLTYEQIAGTNEDWRSAHGRITAADTIEFLEEGENQDKAEAAIADGSRVARGLSRYGILTAMATVSLAARRAENSDVGPSTLSEFYERLADGIMLAPYSPILALRRWTSAETGFHRVPGRWKRPTAIAVTVKALNDYALGNERSMMIWRHSTEPMPALLEKGAVAAHAKAVEERLEEQEQTG